MWILGVEVERETSAPPPKKDPGSAPEKPEGFMKPELPSLKEISKIK